MLFATTTYAQNISVSGTISDYKGALIGASVSVDGTQQGTVTELDGTFNLPNVPSDGVLTFSFIGYKSQSIPIQSMMFFGGKLTSTIDYFDKTTKDLLFQPTMSAVYGNLPSFLLDTWSETNTDAKYARLTTSTADTNNNYILPTDAYLFDGDYLNISLMEFGYSLPKHIINKAKIANLRIYVSVDNLARFQSYPYMNSDISAQSYSDILETGIDYGGYPLARTTRIGANITF